MRPSASTARYSDFPSMKTVKNVDEKFKTHLPSMKTAENVDGKTEPLASCRTFASPFGACLLEHYDEPKPHFNTLSTMVRTLEANGYLSHKAYGNSYQYYPIVTREEYAGSSFKGIISSYFNNSYLSAVSALVKEEKITIEELKGLIEQIENSNS